MSLRTRISNGTETRGGNERWKWRDEVNGRFGTKENMDRQTCVCEICRVFVIL